MPPIDLINVHFINASGEGCSGDVAVPAGSTVQDLCVSKVRGFSSTNYKVRVRRNGEKLKVTPGMLLHEGDQVTVSPSKPAMA